MKICFVSEYYPPKIFGGGEISESLVAKALAKKHEVHVLTSKWKGLKNEEERGGVFIHRKFRTGSPYSLTSNLKRELVHLRIGEDLKILAEEMDFDLIHSWNMSSIPGCTLAKRELEIPTIATINSYWGICPLNRMYKDGMVCKSCNFASFLNCFYRSKHIGKLTQLDMVKALPLFPFFLYLGFMFKKRSLRGLDQLIAISKHLKTVLEFHGAPQKISVIYQPVGIKKFENVSESQVKRIRDKYGLEDKKIVLFVGSLLEIKGVKLLLESVPLVVKEEKNVKFVFVGNGNLLKWKKVVEGWGVTDDVLFVGKIGHEKIPFFYRLADVVVFPSLWPEPFGRVPIEAMASGKPVIGTNKGAIPELVESDFVIRDSRELAGKILEIIGGGLTESSKEKMKHKARRFSPKKISKQYLKMYKRLLR